MRPDEFAQLIRNRYPNGIASDGTPYADLDDEELTRRVVEKHPSYQSKVDTSYKAFGSPVGAVKEFVSGVKNSFKERTGDIKGELNEELGKAQDSSGNPLKNTAQRIVSTPRTSLRVGGAVGGFVGDTTFEMLKLIAPKFVEDAVSKSASAVGETEVAERFATKYSELKEKHPEAMQDIEDIINIAELVPIVKGGSAAIKTGKKGINKVSVLTGEALDARRTARIAAATDEVDSVLGKIVQGKKGDIAKAKRALATIDTSDITNYTELSTKIDDGVEALARKVDDQLETAGKEIGVLKSDDFVQTTKVGKTTVKQNFVEDAIEQLDELYTKTKDPTNKARITELKNKLENDGLTLKETNDLAREYGREFASKAFSKRSGEPLTSINKQAFENTRRGVKRTIRSKMPDDVTRMLDERISDLINTRRLVSNVDEKVNKLWQRVQKRGLAENIARKSADIVNAATFNTVSGFVSRLLPSNVGLKTMNYIDIEKALKKNLKKLDKLLKTTDDKLLEDEVVKMFKKKASNLDNAPKKNKLSEASGFVGGIETDEDGNLTFNPVKSLLGFGVTKAVSNSGLSGKITRNATSKFMDEATESTIRQAQRKIRRLEPFSLKEFEELESIYRTVIPVKGKNRAVPRKIEDIVNELSAFLSPGTFKKLN